MNNKEYYINRIQMDDLIAISFMQEDKEDVLSENEVIKRIHSVLVHAGVPEDHEDLTEIWDYVEVRGRELAYGIN